jgi:signal peptidase I
MRPTVTARVARTARLVLIGVFVVLAAGLAGVGIAARVGPATGHELYAIRSGSMEPALSVGALAVINTEAADPRAGEVIAYRLPNGALVVHRVVAVVNGEAGTFLATKGDANRDPDASLVPLSAVVGRLQASLPFAGYLLALLGMPIGIVTILSVVGTLLTAIWLLDELEEAERPHAPRGLGASSPFRSAGR